MNRTRPVPGMRQLRTPTRRDCVYRESTQKKEIYTNKSRAERRKSQAWRTGAVYFYAQELLKNPLLSQGRGSSFLFSSFFCGHQFICVNPRRTGTGCVLFFMNMTIKSTQENR